MNRATRAKSERVEVLVTWPRVLAMPLALMALWVTLVAVIAVAAPLDFDPLIPVLIGGAGLVALGVPTLAHARRQRRTGDRHGVALRIDSAGIYLGEPPEALPWSAVRSIDIWTTTNTFDGSTWTDRMRANLEPPPAQRDLPAADAGKVRTVVAHRSPRPIPVRIHETSVYNAPTIC
jgi:hypothetical protein